VSNKIQDLADEFNRLYWNANVPFIECDCETMLQVALAGRQLVLEMGREKIIVDSLLNQGNEK
jgi:hypothetical protein